MNERSVDPPCRFSEDAHAWVRWLGHAVRSGHAARLASEVEPGEWWNPDGHSWRLVRTVRGVEIRPGLQPPFIRYGGSPKVTALALETDAIVIELTTQDSRWVDRFPHDAFDVGVLAATMLDEKGLPHDNLRQLFPADASAVETIAAIEIEGARVAWRHPEPRR